LRNSPLLAGHVSQHCRIFLKIQAFSVGGNSLCLFKSGGEIFSALYNMGFIRLKDKITPGAKTPSFAPIAAYDDSRLFRQMIMTSV
jgi:hypothetical protein